MKIASSFHRFCHGFGPHFRWFWDAFPVRAFTSHRTSGTLFLNNTTVFCAQNQVFDLPEKLEFQCFSLSFSIPVLALNFDEVLHWFWLNRGSFFSFFSMLFHDRIFNEFSMAILMEFQQKWLPKVEDLDYSDYSGAPFFLTFSLPFRRTCFWRFLGSLWHPFGSTWVVFGILFN